MRPKSWKNIETSLKLAGTKMTGTCLLIAKQLFSFKDNVHFTIKGLHTRFQNNDINMAQTTVYQAIVYNVDYGNFSNIQKLEDYTQSQGLAT